MDILFGKFNYRNTGVADPPPNVLFIGVATPTTPADTPILNEIVVGCPFSFKPTSRPPLAPTPTPNFNFGWL